MWKEGKLEELLSEGRAIQNRFSKKKKRNNQQEKQFSRFVSLMEQGKVSAALRCIGSEESSVLEINDEVLDELKEKHPEAKSAITESLYDGSLPIKPVQEVIFENIDSIFKTARRMQGYREVMLDYGTHFCAQISSRGYFPSPKNLGSSQS